MKPELLYDKFINWVLTVGPRLILALILLVLGLWLIRIFKNWLKRHFHRKRIEPSFQPFLISLLITSSQIVLILGIMQVMGIRMTIFTALVGAIGVAAGLALSGTMQNFASGVLILLLKPFRIGDNIIAQGQDGTVASIQLFYTVMVTRDNRTVIIPNSKLSNEVIINITKIGKRRLDVELKFHYGFDFETIKRILENSLQASPLVESDPPPRVGVSTLEPDGFRVMVNSWVDAFEFEDRKLVVQQQLIEDLKKAGLKLPGM
jgi:Small-conductance mechanosensitive channel